jgi:phosphoglycerate dehydrogenase-like enzyme
VTVRVLAHLSSEILDRIVSAIPDVEMIEIPREGPIPEGVQGDVLLTFPWATPNAGEAVERGVRWIHTIGTGVDRFPMEIVGDRALSCARGASAVPIAEWVMAMLLAFEKQLPDAWIHEEPERWNFRELGGLDGRTLGLLGIGGIGTAVAQRALPFGMRVRALRRSQAPTGIAGIEAATDLADLLSSADHLVVAASATPETRHLIGRDSLAQVKPGIHLVNVSRGSLVDQEALREALDDGRVACASLDTVEPEPLPPGHWLYTHRRVRLSPHISWNMPDGLDRIFGTFGDNLRRFIAGEPLEGAVDAKRGY